MKTYNADVNGLFSDRLLDLDCDYTYINAYAERKVDGTTTHTARNLQFYYTNDQDYNWNVLLLPVAEPG
jgi:hypothetical protein